MAHKRKPPQRSGSSLRSGSGGYRPLMAGMLLIIAGETCALDPFAIAKDPFGTHNLYSPTPAKALPLPTRKKTRSDNDVSLNGTPFGGPVNTPEALPAEPAPKAGATTTSFGVATPQRSVATAQATPPSGRTDVLTNDDIQSAAQRTASTHSPAYDAQDSTKTVNTAVSTPFAASPSASQSSPKSAQSTTPSVTRATNAITAPAQSQPAPVTSRVTVPDQPRPAQQTTVATGNTQTGDTQTYSTRINTARINTAQIATTASVTTPAPISAPTIPAITRPVAPVIRSRPSIAASSSNDPCMQVVADQTTIDLLQAVEHALCHNPETHQVWAQVKSQAAQVGIAKSAYLPTVELDASYTRGPNSYQVKDTPYLSYNAKTTTRSLGLNASWVLFDFGARRAHLDQAKQLLIAANASQDETLQKVFLQTAQTYYKSVTAQATLDATTEAETLARASFAEANAKYTAGVGTLSDQLQAQTNLSQAQLDRVKAYGELRNTQGELAMRMGLDASTPVTVISSASSLPDTSFVKSVNLLIADAKAQNPGLIAAAAKVEAARASVRATRDEGRPTLSLIGNMNRDHQAGPPPADTDTRNSLVGVQLKVLIFDGFNHTYKVRAAEAELESKQAELDKSEQQVALDVWQNYQNLSTETENLQVTETLVSNADRSYQIAAGRYKAGVGTMVELLSAQNALAKAKSQRIQAQSNWQIARLKLANSLGHLGFWAL